MARKPKSIFKTYSTKLLQTQGRKGRMLHQAMNDWTTLYTQFMDWAKDNTDEILENCINIEEKVDKKGNVAISKKSKKHEYIAQWINIKLKNYELYSPDKIECALKTACKDNITDKISSYVNLVLSETQDNVNFADLNKKSDEFFETKLDYFIDKDWQFFSEEEKKELEKEYEEVSGDVQSYRTQIRTYMPLRIQRSINTSIHNYYIAKSADGHLFAVLSLTPPDGTPMRKLDGDLVSLTPCKTVINKLNNKSAIFPIAMNRWLMRKIEKYGHKSAALRYKNGEFYLDLIIEIPIREKIQHETIIGVDRGVNNTIYIAVTSLDGKHVIETFSVKTDHLQYNKRIKYKRRIAYRKGQMKDFPGKTNAKNKEISNACANIVMDYARKYNSIIAIENLENLKDAKTTKPITKTNFNKQLDSHVYKRFEEALLAKSSELGYNVVEVIPAYTSQTCIRCGNIDKNNRAGEKFVCSSCGLEHNADAIGAINIARRLVKYINFVKDESWQDFYKNYT